ncbi:MAG: hypothetical protein Q8N23_01945 [Archangium sp.]|nr:hypothetical protein [Archangium sp.]MDP3151402.1 hypothetical protein [Archangium sp.]MDP3575294.1 hypothetical protein [Archangium sp.]
MAFKASKAKSGLFEIHGLESFIEKKFAELKKAFGVETAAPKKSAAAPKARKAAAPAKKTASAKADPLAQILANLDAHPKKANLIKAGKQKDQLLRSLIPLYVARGTVEVSSGITSKFWAKHGITYAAPNVAKALREHVGYARRTAKGPQITPNGVKYVEQALSNKTNAA